MWSGFRLHALAMDVARAAVRGWPTAAPIRRFLETADRQRWQTFRDPLHVPILIPREELSPL